MPRHTKGPSARELCSFTRQFAISLRAGLPLMNALTILQRNTRSVALVHAVERALHVIGDGGSLSAGLAQSPRVFNKLYVSLIACGERAGILEKTLERLSKTLETSCSLRSRMIRAMAYPAVVVATLIAVVFFLLTSVVPTFEELFNEQGAQLPLLTRLVVAAAHFLCDSWSYALGACGCFLLWGSWLTTHSPRARIAGERFVLSIPLVQDIIRKRHGSECASLLSALLGAGMPIIEAIDVIRGTTQSVLVNQQLAETQTAILNGASLATALLHVTIFPALVPEMAGVGEASGQLEEIFLKAGSYLEEEVAATIAVLQELAEPTLVVLIGLVVGTLVIALYLPIFNLGVVSEMR